MLPFPEMKGLGAVHAAVTVDAEGMGFAEARRTRARFEAVSAIHTRAFSFGLFDVLLEAMEKAVQVSKL